MISIPWNRWPDMPDSVPFQWTWPISRPRTISTYSVAACMRMIRASNGEYEILDTRTLGEVAYWPLGASPILGGVRSHCRGACS